MRVLGVARNDTVWEPHCHFDRPTSVISSKRS